MKLSTMQQDTPQYRGARHAEHDGFSLLELVVAVSIMLILGVVGTVSYQAYTDNARQAALETSANQVLTAVIAEGNAPNGDVEKAVANFNQQSDDIMVDITTATSQQLSVEASTCAGGSSVASAPGDYDHLDTTTFADVQYDWTNEAHNSPSTKTVCGEVVQTNHAVNPVNAVGLGWLDNVQRNFTSHDVTIHDHPLGITTAFQSQRGDGAPGLYSMSIYNMGGGTMSTEGYYTGVWVKTDRPGEAAVGFSEKYQEIPVNEWYFLVSETRREANTPGVSIRHYNSQDAEEATSWATGAIITYDEPPTEYFDGDM